jgi:hypothetical protein
MVEARSTGISPSNTYIHPYTHPSEFMEATTAHTKSPQCSAVHYTTLHYTITAL